MKARFHQLAGAGDRIGQELARDALALHLALRVALACGLAVDTNVLVQAVLQDDPGQCRAARKLLKEATLITVPSPCLCELAWILRRGAKLPKEDVAAAIRALLDTKTVIMNRPAVEAGLAFLEAGGDFADGVIAYEGR